MTRANSSRPRKIAQIDARGCAPKLFTYTAEQWSKIERCAAATKLVSCDNVNGCSVIPDLTESVQLRLLKAARQYCADVNDLESGNYASSRERKKYWNQLRTLLAKVRDTLERAPNVFGDSWHSKELVWITEELANDIAKRIAPPALGPFDPAQYMEPDYLDLDCIRRFVAELEQAAKYHSFVGEHMRLRATCRLDPSALYYYQVLDVWMLLGGKLTLPTRDLETGKLGNDLLKFFRSVTDPVMGSRRPSDESLPDIVKRQRKLCERGPYFKDPPF